MEFQIVNHFLKRFAAFSNKTKSPITLHTKQCARSASLVRMIGRQSDRFAAHYSRFGLTANRTQPVLFQRLCPEPFQRNARLLAEIAFLQLVWVASMVVPDPSLDGLGVCCISRAHALAMTSLATRTFRAARWKIRKRLGFLTSFAEFLSQNVPPETFELSAYLG